MDPGILGGGGYYLILLTVKCFKILYSLNYCVWSSEFVPLSDIIYLSDSRQTSLSLRTIPLKPLWWVYTCTVTLKII